MHIGYCIRFCNMSRKQNQIINQQHEFSIWFFPWTIKIILISNFCLRNLTLFFVYINHYPPPLHTLERKCTKTGTVECIESDQKSKISPVKNWNKRKNRLTPVKLQCKKQDEKMIAQWEGFGREVPIDL